MQRSNLSLLFNEFYYKSKDNLNYDQEMIRTAIASKKELSKQQEELINNRNKNIENFTINKREKEAVVPWTHAIEMKTTYPGLITGIGLPHSIGFDGEYKTGFQFDFTTGLPYIPGSSVKGTIRSFLDNINASSFQRFKSHFSLTLDFNEFTTFRDLFFNEVTENQPFVFFDAEILKGDASDKILVEDYLAPHSDLTKNPVPIKFLKIRPNVILEFRFFLKDLPFLSAEEQLKMINEILMLFGIGAKTNVGYGYFNKDYSIAYLKKYLEKKEEEKLMDKRKTVYIDYMQSDQLTKLKTMFPTDEDLKDAYLNYINGNLTIDTIEWELKEFISYFTDEQIEEINQTLIFSNLEKDDKIIVFEYIEDIMGELDNWKAHKDKDQETLEKKKRKNKEIKRYLKFKALKEKLSN